MTRLHLFMLFEKAIVILFLLLIAVDLYVDISWHHSVQLAKIFLPVVLITTIIYKTKISWLTAILLFAYGIYYYIFERIYAAEPGSFVFTSSLTQLISGDESGYTRRGSLLRYFSIFPFVFYVVGIIIFMTKSVRRRYWND